MGKIEKIDDLYQSFSIDGVEFAGFGRAAGIILEDPDLSYDAKAVYLNLCSFRGQNSLVFPNYTTVCSELKIGTNKFYSCRDELIKNEIISKISFRSKPSYKVKTKYIFNKMPNKYNGRISLDMSDVTFQKEGIYAHSSEIVPRSIMKDPRLDYKEIVLYCYLSCLTRGGSSASPGREKILNDLKISERTYKSYLRKLIDYNYITVKQVHLDGHFSSVVYTFMENPDLSKATKGCTYEAAYKNEGCNSEEEMSVQGCNSGEILEEDNYRQGCKTNEKLAAQGCNSEENVAVQGCNSEEYNKESCINKIPHQDSKESIDDEDILLKISSEKKIPTVLITQNISLKKVLEKLVINGVDNCERGSSLIKPFCNSLTSLVIDPKTINGVPVEPEEILFYISKWIEVDSTGRPNISRLYYEVKNRYCSRKNEEKVHNNILYLKTLIFGIFNDVIIESEGNGSEENLLTSNSKIEKILEERRQTAEKEQQEMYFKICKKIPEFKELSEKIVSNSILMSRMLLGKNKEEYTKTKNENVSLIEKRDNLLISNGFTPEDLKTPYFCKKCNDTGYLEDNSSCSCRKALINELKKSPLKI